jgi:hypothetical protein
MSDLADLEQHAFVVPRDQLDAAWPIIADIVSRVTDVSWTLDNLKADLADGSAQAWGMREGDEVRCVLVTRVENAFGQRYGLLWIAAGSGIVDGMRLFREYIEPWFFDDQDCERIEIQGRRGWARLLQDYQERAVVLSKDRPKGKVH